ncbi:hypothetical protein [Nocardia inohanensis]|uniref:hypothetical protein n=1 Tax=Nocardia inohanensis TaxID=209246 RepID=UPI000832113C|nr:hypothetical protein [Nocardia inohanensis]
MKDAPIPCNDLVTSADAFYDGPRASDVYDNRFHGSHAVPHLDTHVPQGLAAWSNWDGENDLLLITACVPDSDENAYLIGLDAKSGKHIGTARIDPTHGGAIAVLEEQGWAFISGTQHNLVRAYPLDRLRGAIADSSHIAADGTDREVSGGSSLLAGHGPTGTLWAGAHEPDTRAEMYSYRVDSNGELDHREGPWELPQQTRGVAVTSEVFIYSTSHGGADNSTLFVVRRGEDAVELDTARLLCFRSPSMSAGLAIHGQDIYVVYESGAAHHRADPSNLPRNIIEHLHRAQISELADLPPHSGPNG